MFSRIRYFFQTLLQFLSNKLQLQTLSEYRIFLRALLQFLLDNTAIFVWQILGVIITQEKNDSHEVQVQVQCQKLVSLSL